MLRHAFWQELGRACVCLTLTLLFFHQVVMPRTETFIYNFDNTYQYYAWMHKVVNDWRTLSPPLWDFAVDAGLPFPGEMQTAAFYPVNIVFAWFAGTVTPAKLDLLLLLHCAAGMWGMTLFLRQRGILFIASLLGGAAFCWVGAVAARAAAQANIFAGLIYLPWVVFWFQRAVVHPLPGRRPAFAALAGIALALSLLAGHPQPFIHNALLLGAFAVYLCFEMSPRGEGKIRQVRQVGLLLAFAGVIATLLVFMQVAASEEYFNRAYRWIGLTNPVKGLDLVPASAYELYSLSFRDVVGALHPAGGADAGMPFLTITVLVCAGFGLAARGKWRWFSLCICAFCILVALGGRTPIGSLVYHLPVLNRVREPVRILYLYQFCIATLAASGLNLVLRDRNQPSRAIIAAITFLLFVTEARLNGRSATAPVSTPISADVAYRETRVIQKLEAENAARHNSFRVIGRPKEAIPPNGGDVFYFNNALGHRSSMLISYFDFLNGNGSGVVSPSDEAAIRYVVTLAPEESATPISADAGRFLYENASAKPIVRIEDAGAVVDGAQTDRVRWRRRSVTLEAHTPRDASVVLAVSSYPGWRAYVDGVRSPIQPLHTFMSVAVQQGSHTVDFRYQPWWFNWGIMSWAIGAGLTIWLFVRTRRSHAPRGPSITDAQSGR